MSYLKTHHYLFITLSLLILSIVTLTTLASIKPKQSVLGTSDSGYIVGSAVEDTNKNGVLDYSGEDRPYTGLSIKLTGTASSSAKISKTTVSNGGTYEFSNLPLGHYSLVPETNQEIDVRSIGPTSFDLNNLNPSATGTTFLVIKNSTSGTRIVGTSYLDKNRNGSQDSGELMDDLPVSIKNNTTSAEFTQNTVNGAYDFKDIPLGAYTVTARTNLSYKLVGPSPNLTSSNPIATGPTIVVSPADQIGIIVGWAFYDANKNKVYDKDDLPFSGMKIKLTSGATEVSEALTDSKGRYRFNFLALGTYKVLLDDVGLISNTRLFGPTEIVLEKDNEVGAGPLILSQNLTQKKNTTSQTTEKKENPNAIQKFFNFFRCNGLYCFE